MARTTRARAAKKKRIRWSQGGDEPADPPTHHTPGDQQHSEHDQHCDRTTNIVTCHHNTPRMRSASADEINMPHNPHRCSNRLSSGRGESATTNRDHDTGG